MPKRSKIKFEYIIVAVAILFLLIYLLTRNPDRVFYELPELAHLKSDRISKMEIVKSAQTMSIEKGEGEVWRIQPQAFPADSEKINKAVDVLSGLSLTDVVSESQNFTLYGLDEENRITVRVFTAEGLAREMAVGKQAATHRHTYVKLAGDQRVFHARESFRHHFDQTIDDLRDKTVQRFDNNEIVAIRLSRNETTLSFKKSIKTGDIQVDPATAAEEDASTTPPQTESWILEDGREGDATRLESLLGELNNLKCEKFVEGKTKNDFVDPIYTVTLKGNKDHILMIYPRTGEKESDPYPAVSSASDYPFLLSSYKAGQIMKKPEDLIKSASEKENKPK